MSKWTLVALCAILILSIACGSQTVPPPPGGSGGPVATRVRTKTPVPSSDEEALRQLINAECEAVVQQDIDRLQGMWVNDGIITDANHTPDNASDDVTWKGWEAIRDRYVNIVFPSNPTFCEHPDVKANISGDGATADSGVNIGVTKCSGCNKWTFRKSGDGWRVAALTYNLSPQK